jgi:hypothetical protein
MDFNNNFYEEFMSIKTRPPVSSDGFDSQWEFLKATSYYHFDNTIEDTRTGTCVNPIYIPVANFKGDWDADVKTAKDMSEPHVPYVQNVQAKKIAGTFTRRNQFERNDMERWGYIKKGVPPYVAVNRGNDANFGFFKKIADLFHFDRITSIRCDVQHPGHAFYYHIDNFGYGFEAARQNYEKAAEIDTDQRKIARFVVFLTDWEPGHIWMQGNMILKWNRGDCFTYPWRDMPHGTANFGHSTRVALNVTGFLSEKSHVTLQSFPKFVDLDSI